MDKYLDKSNNSNSGLDNVGNLSRQAYNYNKEKSYESELHLFKQKIMTKLHKFNPQRINDSFDNTLKLKVIFIESSYFLFFLFFLLTFSPIGHTTILR